MTYFLAVTMFLGAILVARRYYSSGPLLNCPPGPKPECFFGNMRQFTSEPPWLQYSNMKRKFGELIFLSFFSQPVVVLNSLETIRDILERKATATSGRPRMIIFGELVGWEDSITLVPYGPKWNSYRKLYHQILGKNVMSDWIPSIEHESRMLVKRILDSNSSNSWVSDLRLSLVKHVLNMAYGLCIESVHDPYVALAEKIAEIFEATVEPGRFAVEVFPILKYVPSWMPFAGFKRLATKWRMESMEAVSIPFERVKKDMAEGIARPCFASKVLEENSEDLDEDSLKYLSGSIYGAGVGTTGAVIKTFALAMLLHPKVQEKAQKEIDDVIGGHRLPSYEDRERLPYVDCVYKETLRWHPVVPIGTPHLSMEELDYCGYRIPKGSMLLPNYWEASRDEIMYPDPEKFFPERFEGDAGSKAPDPRQYVFGSGRRICPGIHFAEAVLWSTMVSFLATTRISKANGDNGEEISPTVSFGGSFVSHPDDFACLIRPKSPLSLAMLYDATST